MFSDADKTDIRRFCGYPAYGAGVYGNMGWRFYQAYGALEYRMNNLSAAEIAVVQQYLATLRALEAAIPQASASLDTESASVWTRNADEMAERNRLFDDWARRLCGFFGVPPGDALQRRGGVAWIV